jgi:hypothetical protein
MFASLVGISAVAILCFKFCSVSCLFSVFRAVHSVDLIRTQKVGENIIAKSLLNKGVMIFNIPQIDNYWKSRYSLYFQNQRVKMIPFKNGLVPLITFPTRVPLRYVCKITKNTGTIENVKDLNTLSTFVESRSPLAYDE